MLRNLDAEPLRVRNVGAEAAGDWVVRRSSSTVWRRCTRAAARAVRRARSRATGRVQTIAANVDVVMLVHALTSPPNQRRLERELVLARGQRRAPPSWSDEADLVEIRRHLSIPPRGAPGVSILTASGITGEGVDSLAAFAAGNATIALLGASGVGKSTLINAWSAAGSGNGRRARATVAAGTQRSRQNWCGCRAAGG